jgi:hypothetical protein
MILTAHQPTYLPWLGLFDKIARADQFCIFDVCPMEDSGYENRTKILTHQGEQWLTVPVRKSRSEHLSELRIVGDLPWARKHWRSIEQAYRKAPFWDRYAPDLEPFYLATHWQRLVDLDEVLLRWCMNALGLRRPVRRASTLGPLAGVKSELVLSMCKAMGADVYVFGAMGREYADVEAFKKAGIEARFQEYQQPTYPQVGGNSFVPKLSVLDLIMNVGPDSLRVLRNESRSEEAR